MTIQIRETACVHPARLAVILQFIRVCGPTSLNGLGENLVNELLLVDTEGEQSLSCLSGVVALGTGADEDLEAVRAVEHQADGAVWFGEAEGLGLGVAVLSDGGESEGDEEREACFRVGGVCVEIESWGLLGVVHLGCQTWLIAG